VLGLARRGQALAGRQLRLLEGLTRDEPDPQRRRDLLGLDNLAGRLRRTAETTLAVAGPGRCANASCPCPSMPCSAPPSPRPSPAGPPPRHPGRGAGSTCEDGYLVEITDRGLGMTDQELAWANQRLASRGPGADLANRAAGDRLGLVVAGGWPGATASTCA
jgi:hypothetical protein